MTTARIPLLLIAGLALQFLWHGHARWEDPGEEKLADAPNVLSLRISGLGESELMSRYAMLYLQSFDIQPGLIIPYRDLDYGRVVKWMEASLALDEKDPYPLFAATYLYSSVQDENRKRIMLDFIYREYLKDPGERWPWLARGALIAKYELHDLPLALKYSETLGRNESPELPDWAREMSIFVLEDMNALQSAKILLGGLLARGKIRDPNEILFLKRELDRISRK